MRYPADWPELSETRLRRADNTPTALAAPAPLPTSAARRVIYTGRLTVLSPDPEGAVKATRQLAEDAGGFVDSIKGQRVVLRVPAETFDATMQAIADLGLVTDRQIDAADVTEQMVDLEIRLDNFEALRQRLQALLEKADDVEDTLKIEKELGRLTGEIESIKGKLRLLRDRVALSTITASFNAPAGTASGLATRVRPFGWVNGVGDEAFGRDRLPAAQPRLGKGPDLDLPDGFVRFYQQQHRVYAIDGGQLVMKVTRNANYDEADAAFWKQQVHDRLTQDLGVPVAEPEKVEVDDAEGYVMTGSRTAGQNELGYFVGLTRNDDYVFLVEAWGPAAPLTDRRDELVESLRTLRVSRGWW
jgi:hypothetical protein